MSGLLVTTMMVEEAGNLADEVGVEALHAGDLPAEGDPLAGGGHVVAGAGRTRAEAAQAVEGDHAAAGAHEAGEASINIATRRS
mmetsp:Transcript_31304/g.57354  ORF Transcript_31304/g.57354 Transcript_31304/m.57354 type:complete len:84 (+) Transcript_31304:385-636(+)